MTTAARISMAITATTTTGSGAGICALRTETRLTVEVGTVAITATAATMPAIRTRDSAGTAATMKGMAGSTVPAAITVAKAAIHLATFTAKKTTAAALPTVIAGIGTVVVTAVTAPSGSVLPMRYLPGSVLTTAIAGTVKTSAAEHTKAKAPVATAAPMNASAKTSATA